MDKEFAISLEWDEDGVYVASCPGLKGCWSQGRTGTEALEDIHEAITGWLEVTGVGWPIHEARIFPSRPLPR
jgi:predicted RNase H-like HicB family nuclease